MNKPKDEAARIEVAMGYCPECHAPYRHLEQKGAFVTPGVRLCVGDGREYVCNKDKNKNGHARAAPGRWV